MQRQPEPNRKQLRDRKGERGSTLVVALLSLLALFAITLAATQVRISSARDIEDKTNQSIQYWNARSAAATIQASLITDIPQAFDSDLQRAQIAANGYPLPAFDQTNIQPSNSLPVLNADGSISNTPTRQCTSLLGNLDAWAQRKGAIAESYAAARGYGSDKARIAVLREYQRQQLMGVGNSEPAYVLQYMIDAAVGQQGNARGRVRPSGTIMLGPSQPSCNTTVALAANPPTIALGASSVLTVTYTNANHVWLVDQTGTVVTGTDTTGLTETNAAQTVSFTVSPTDDMSYRAVGQGASGCQAISAFVTVAVTYPPPLIIAFDANPACITRGESSTLSFTVQYATSITITGGGVNQTFAGNSGTALTSGSLTVSPTVDTTYTLIATGKGGTASRTVTVSVKQLLTIDNFISDTYCLTPPANTVNLTWAVSNAETVTITDNSTEIVTGVSATGGTRAFTVNNPTTFTLTATRTGCDGTPDVTTRDISINQNAVPTASFSANPSAITLGNTTLLQWSTTNTTDDSSVTISASPAAGSGISTPQTVTPNGTLRIQPTAINAGPGYTYTLTVTNAGCNTQTITRTTVVLVTSTPAPPSCPNVQSFDGDACLVSGNSGTLRWNVANADFVDITGPGVSQTFSANPVGTGSMTVTPTADATYTLSARTNSTGPQQVTWVALVGANASTNNLTKTQGDGWNAGASSAQAIVSGDGYVQFTASETNKHRMLGLSKGDSNQNYTDIDFAFYPAADGGLYVYEGGTSRGYFGPYTTGDLLKVSIEGGQVKYRRNGTLLYTSTVAPSYPLLVDTSLYSNGATLNNVIISGNIQTTSTPSSVGLAAYWNLDEGSGTSGADGSGNNHTGYLLNGTTWTAGKVGGSALSFDGANNLFGINIDDMALANTFSYSFWAYPTLSHDIDPESTSGYAGYSGQRFALSPSWYEAGDVDAAISVATNGVSVYENGDSDFAALLVYSAPITGWTHITVVFENKRPRLYINGALVRTGLTSRQTTVHSTPGYIGGGFYGYYGGNLDDFRVYNRALTNTEVQTVYGSGSPGALSCTPASPPNPTTATFTIRVGQRPTVSNLAATPSTIDAGQTSRLTWTNTGNFATARIIGSGGDTSTYTVPAAQQYLDVRPNSTATYTVIVTSNDCAAQSASQATTVTVVPCPSITTSFRATPSTIFQGQSSTLQWGIANATQVLLNGSPVAASGSLSVSPGATTTYRLTAVSRNGSCSFDQFVTVTVNPCPAPTINSFTATPNAVTIGGTATVTLAWSVTDTSGTGVSITIPGVGTWAAPNGSVTISQPQSTTTYTLVATTGCGASSSRQVTVTANACPAPTINSFTASPSAVTIGGNVTVRLSWSIADPSGSGVTVTIPGVGSWSTLTGFVDIAQPQSTTTYTLTASAGCGASSSRQVTITASACPAPTINSFTASPSAVTIGGSVTVRLSWSIADPSGTGVTVTIPGAGTWSTLTGFVDIAQPQSTTTYTLTARAGCGASSSSQTTVTASACPPATINSFTASPSVVTIGGNVMVRLQWSITDSSGTGITISIPGVGTFSNPNSFVDITQPQSSTTYTLNVTVGCGATSSAQATVTANACPAPIINSFTASPNVVTIGGGQTVRLSWSVTDNSGTGGTVTIPRIGTFGLNGFVDIPQPQSTITYTLTATVGCGAQSTSQTTVTANACPVPIIDSFAANPASVTIGGTQTVRLSWSVTDNSGTGVTVSIAGVGSFAASGFVDIAQPQSTTTYALTATAGCSAQSTSQITVTATPNLQQRAGTGRFAKNPQFFFDSSGNLRVSSGYFVNSTIGYVPSQQIPNGILGLQYTAAFTSMGSSTTYDPLPPSFDINYQVYDLNGTLITQGNFSLPCDNSVTHQCIGTFGWQAPASGTGPFKIIVQNPGLPTYDSSAPIPAGFGQQATIFGCQILNATGSTYHLNIEQIGATDYTFFSLASGVSNGGAGQVTITDANGQTIIVTTTTFGMASKITLPQPIAFGTATLQYNDPASTTVNVTITNCP